MSNEFSRVIQEAIAALAKPGNNEELAYLAVTSKPELPFRDRLAYELHKTMKDTHLVAREWCREESHNRADIAILSKPDTTLKAVIELKAWSLFAIEKHKSDVGEQLKSAAQTWVSVKRLRPQLYWLLVATRLESWQDSGPAGQLDAVVKYADGWRDAFAKYRSADAIYQTARHTLESCVTGWDMRAERQVPGGRVFGLDVSLDVWLLEHRD